MFMAIIAMVLAVIRPSSNKHSMTEARASMKACKQPVRAGKRMGRNVVANNHRAKQRRKQNGHAKKNRTGRLGTNAAAQRKLAICVIALLTISILKVSCLNWDPHNAVLVGQAAVPGPVSIVSRNIHGIYANLMECKRSKADIICIREADIAEADVIDFTMQAAAAGYTCKWGQPTQVAKTDGGKSGRRVATMLKNPIDALRHEDNEEHDDPNLKYLRASGRWMEVVVPVSDGRKQIINATLYGISGSNSDNAKFDENERLIAAALIRMNHYKDIAYFICTDINVEPTSSVVLMKAREAGLVYDIVFFL
jgi:hypothetical protein